MKQFEMLAVLTLMIPSQVVAGGTAVIESRTEEPAMTGQTEVLWRDGGMLRMNSGEEQAYMIIRDGAAYSVMEDAGETRVFQMTGASEATPGAGQDESAEETAEGNPFGTIDSVEATGNRETVAGVEGEVYRVTVTPGDGETVEQEWVLTSDPLVTEMTDAYLGSLESMFGTQNTGTGLGQMQAALPEDRRGLLRADVGFRLISISPDDPTPDLFDLPAEPVSLQDLFQKGMGGQ